MSGITIILKVYIVNLSKEMEHLKKSKCHHCTLETLSEDTTSQLDKKVPNPGSNLGLPHCRQTLYHLSHQGSLNHKLNKQDDNIQP